MIEAIEDFLADVRETRMNRELNETELSKRAFGHTAGLSQIRSTESPGVVSLQKVANALGCRLVICLVEKEEEE